MTHTRFYFAPAVIALAVTSLTLSSCGNETVNTETNDVVDSTVMNINTDVSTAENVFNYMPSPIETADLLKKSGATYNDKLLNDPNLVSNYTTANAQALNLGIYGADLSFAGIFDQHAETMIYLSCARKLADNLHVGSAFGESTKKRLETNINNRDSILAVISDSYWDCDAVFKENDMRQASMMMVAGGWVEGLYLACKVAESTNSNDIRIRIVEQRYSLESLISLLEKDQQQSDVAAVLKELKELKLIFDALPKPPNSSVTATTDDQSGVTTIGGDEPPAISMNALEFKRILDKVTSMRQGMITMK